jgi:hypothetical protein
VRHLVQHKNTTVNMLGASAKVSAILFVNVTRYEEALMTLRQLLNHDDINVTQMGSNGETLMDISWQRESYHTCALLSHDRI